MANRYFSAVVLSAVKLPVMIFANVSIGGTGAPTLNVNTPSVNIGIKSVVRNSAGNYTFTFGTNNSSNLIPVDTYYNTLSINCIFNTAATAAAPAAPLYYISANTISTTGKVTLQFTNTSQAATDPASGEILHVQFIWKNSGAV